MYQFQRGLYVTVFTYLYAAVDSSCMAHTLIAFGCCKGYRRRSYIVLRVIYLEVFSLLPWRKCAVCSTTWQLDSITDMLCLLVLNDKMWGGVLPPLSPTKEVCCCTSHFIFQFCVEKHVSDAVPLSWTENRVYFRWLTRNTPVKLNEGSTWCGISPSSLSYLRPTRVAVWVLQELCTLHRPWCAWRSLVKRKK